MRKEKLKNRLMDQMKIGRVIASEGIVQEISETEDFQTFCMSCVRRHRNGDWGDIQKENWIQNNLCRRKGDEVQSEYMIPAIFCIGYADRIIVNTNPDRTETRISFPDE